MNFKLKQCIYFRIIVGAPKGNQYKKDGVVTKNNNWGSVYSCVVTPNPTDCELLDKVDYIKKRQGKKFLIITASNLEAIFVSLATF